MNMDALEALEIERSKYPVAAITVRWAIDRIRELTRRLAEADQQAAELMAENYELREFILRLGHKCTDAVETIMRKAEPPTPIEEIRQKAARLAEDKQ